ncbi:stage II sporulation protein E [Pseudalkalibacillus berkeleyi]|uniref:Stage II sporulation protein E n=1 Tax=Pseudalkalibacillus berkeleyi TaxID=1069813 RepID=A0ABS9H6L5_9BACL|nr:stage II sporulation protein E [Pseudalkalibacillus berkeleyi]MCF6139604.1 stage II sporulation protein E [Pseudalkalibacillus berkeleyi]
MMQKVGAHSNQILRKFVLVERLKNNISMHTREAIMRVQRVLMHWSLVLFCTGFLLGRAFILTELSPFAIPFFGAVLLLKRERAGVAAIALLAGALTTFDKTGLFISVGLAVFFVINAITTNLVKQSFKILPYTVVAASFITRMSLLTFASESITTGTMLMVAIEAGLSGILTLIFLQSIPLLSIKKIQHSLKNEEIVCFIILLASVMTGTIGWQVYDLSLEHILSRYLVLIFAIVGGTAIGATVGVVTGLILGLANIASLYQMSLLAFSGLLGGLLKEGKKLGVGVGLFIGTMLIGLYGNESGMLFNSFLESCVAVGLFLLTPNKAISKISRYIPGTKEYNQEQQQYLRKVRDVTANRVEQFSHLFQTLSNSFLNTSATTMLEEEGKRELDMFLSNITEKTCQNCFKKRHCWVNNFEETYGYMANIMTETTPNGTLKDRGLQKDWERHCVRSKKVIDTIQYELGQYHANIKLKQQVKESRRLVAEQLHGVSQVMDNFAKEIQRERENHQIQEEQVKLALDDIGLEVGNIEIYNLDKGSIDIEMSIPYCNGRGEAEKVIAPLLSDILDEAIVVKNEECAAYPNGYCHVVFRSSQNFVIETGVASAAKGGAWVSGDSHSTIELGVGKYAVAISDGMGNGERAHLESNETLKLLQQILQSGIDETTAIKSVNSILSLRTTDEIFSTLDLAMIDLQDAAVRFLKIGSSPSFVKRADQVRMIEASNLPMGIIEEFDVEVVSDQLKAGDFLIMMSDGIFEGPKNVENKEAWIKRKIREIHSDDPQLIADLLLEEVIRTDCGHIDDDMTVVVTKLNRNIPKWSTIRYQNKGEQKQA